MQRLMGDRTDNKAPARSLEVASRIVVATLITGVAVLGIASPATANKRVANATAKVKRWESPQSYNTPFALVKIKHNHKVLERTPINRCKGTYVSKDLAVMVSTCGHRWHVRASYVSMSGRDERFGLVYEARKKP
jgi:hypothetical protein